jgi:arthrofactin-type cyclic lipopeptide synthetase C
LISIQYEPNNRVENGAIGEAIVVGQQNDLGETRSVAYFTSNAESAPKASELRRYLNEKFPYYMIPLRFVLLSALPLAPNGKIERGALTDPGTASITIILATRI